MKKFLLLLALMLSALPGTGQVTFNLDPLPGAGYISGGIFNASGQLVKQMRWGAKDTAVAYYSTGGVKQFVWNGLDNDGISVPNPTTCKPRVLYRPTQLLADYLMSPGNSFPRGPSWWETGVGSHSGIRSVAADASGIYMGAGISESVTNGAKFNLDMTARTWSAWQPGSFMGRWSMGVSGSNVYFLQANGWLAWHGTSNPNVLYYSVGRWQENGAWVGKRAHVSWSTPMAGQTNVWKDWPNQDMDMAIRGTTIAVSYQDHNAVRFYTTTGATDLIKDTTILKDTDNDGQKDDPVLFRNVYYYTRLPVIRTVTSAALIAPKGVTLDASGNAYVCSGNKILKITQAGVVTTFSDGTVQGYSNPYRLTIAPDGEFFVGCGAPSHQMVRLNASGARNRDPYGRNGGREYGLYIPRNLKGITDVEWHPNGGLLIVEGVPPHRVVWLDEATGDVKREFVGAGSWMPSGALNPINPSEAWIVTQSDEVMRVDINYADRTWKIHSTFRPIGMASGLVQARFTGNDEGLGGGFGDWTVKVYKANTYLCRREYQQILFYDRYKNTMRAVVAADLTDNAANSYVWTDANGDGLVQSSERVTGGTDFSEWFEATSAEAAGDFSYYRWSKYATAQFDGGAVKRWKHTEFNSVGAPLFQAQTVNDVVVSSIPGVDIEKYYLRSAKHPQMSCTDGKYLWLFEQVQEANDGWNRSRNGSIRIYKAPASGTGAYSYVGKVSKWVATPGGAYNYSPAPAAGYQYVFKNCVGSVHGVGVFTDFNGGFSGRLPAITYAYHGETGGYVGGLFVNFSTTRGQRSHDYYHNGDNGTGRIYPERQTGEALYIAGGSADTRLYRITGWKNWRVITGTAQ